VNAGTWISVLILLNLGAGAAIGHEKKVWDQAPPPLVEFEALEYRDFLPGADPSERTAFLLNDLGLEAYEKDELLEAARLFRLALEMDADNAFAHYNYSAMLAVFAQGFEHFAAPAHVLMTRPWRENETIAEYRRGIFNHLKTSIAMRPERLERARDDSDFDSIRQLSEYEYLLMGRNPDVETVVRVAPRWYSVQPGAFLPEDNFEFLPEYRVRFEYDTRRFELFPEMEDKIDRSFSGSYRIEGDRLIIFPDGSQEVIYGEFSLRLDGRGFVVRRLLEVEGYGPFSDEESHFWEGQDA
jgi:hypothetical protein